MVNAVPAVIKHNHVVELQALGAMGGQQHEPALAATQFLSPLGQPFDEVVPRIFRATGLQRVFGFAFLQQFGPRA